MLIRAFLIFSRDQVGTPMPGTLMPCGKPANVAKTSASRATSESPALNCVDQVPLMLHVQELVLAVEIAALVNAGRFE